MWRIRLVLALLIAGLASGPGPAGAQATKLTWWEHANPPHNEYSKELVARYHRAQSKVAVSYEVFPMTPYFKKVTVAMSTKTGPDIFTVMDPLMPTFIEKKMMVPLDPRSLGHASIDDMKSKYLPGALDGYMAEGKLYALPIVSGTMSLYLNKRHFEEAGLDPDKDYPQTWDQLARIGKKLVKFEGDKMVREAFDFAMHSSSWTMSQFEPILRQFGGSTLDPTGRKCTVNSEAGVKAMRLRASFALEHKISDPTVSVATHPLPAEDLAQGRVSMFVTHPGSVAQFGPEKMKDLKVVSLPQVDPQKPVTHFYGFALAVNPDIPADRQKAAHGLMRFLIQNPKEWLEHTAYPLPVKNFLEIPGVRSHPYIDVFIQDMSTGRFVTRSPKFTEIADAMHRAMERVVLNRVDPKRSLDQACQEIDLALSKP
ncbi:MAG TPA: extracellular solute-binding protein [Methylomirabilota bacterium]|jgi:multiple sugar transport system substrate-binding protein|nr:extracellular solute-binding protein [Methylomirabilota bacterium]